jgi:hypothetical protein
MNESEWMASAECDRMLDYIPYRISQRKWRLIAVGFCRRIWGLLVDERSRQAVDASERWADGLIQLNQMNRIWNAAEPTLFHPIGDGPQEAPSAAHAAASPSKSATFRAAMRARTAVQVAGGSAPVEERHQCDLIRDIVGNPFHRIALDRQWVSWNHGTLPAIARHIYEGRAYYDLPILADALEDAGFANTSILDHCRLPVEHVRGCWVVDLLLGKA